MELEVKTITGTAKGSVKLNDYVFKTDISKGSVYHGIRNELANKRQGTAKTKGRSEVLYSGKKPWKQKGTGRARAGSRRSPLWVGGGTVFGPAPRDYSYSLPKKMKKLAFRSVFTEKVSAGLVEVVEDFAVESRKTKDCAKILSSLVPSMNRTVLIVGDEALDIKISARNIPWVRVYTYSRLLLKDLFYAKKILILKSAIEKLNGFYGEDKKE